MDRALAVDGRVGRQRFVGARRLANERGVLVGLAIVTLAFGALVGPRFFAAANLELMARQTVIVCVAALGMTMIIVSGGNQQKVAVARLLHHDVDVLILDEPTRGIDVASKAQIYTLIDELVSGRDKAVLLVSSYLPELLGVCDRIAVMSRGRLGPARPVEAWTEHSLLMEASGARAS